MPPTHGIASTYRSRSACRCDACREANTARYRAEKQARAARLAVDPTLAPHGKVTTYTNWGCRCAPCSQANADRCREWKQRRRSG